MHPQIGILMLATHTESFTISHSLYHLPICQCVSDSCLTQRHVQSLIIYPQATAICLGWILPSTGASTPCPSTAPPVYAAQLARGGIQPTVQPCALRPSSMNHSPACGASVYSHTLLQHAVGWLQPKSIHQLFTIVFLGLFSEPIFGSVVQHVFLHLLGRHRMPKSASSLAVAPFSFLASSRCALR